VIGLRSSPWKAGGESTPWHDAFDLDHGHVRYFGDHKATTPVALGRSRGNAVLLEAWEQHRGATPQQRLTAPPIMLFRSISVDGARKGNVQFCGVAVLERLEHVVQRDPTDTGKTFANYVFDLAVLDTAAENEAVDWRWIDDRRNPDLSCADTLRHAPHSWKQWVKHGSSILPRVRRRVATSRVRSRSDQLPPPGTAEHDVLDTIYRYYDQRKHAFEMLAARIAGDILRGRGAAYHEGWLTRGGGDGGTDFVGRLDVGSGTATTSLVVLGQAKCIQPTSQISAEQIARVIARLQRGWIGVYVTTGTYSRAAQEEIIDDRYPIVLIDAAGLAVTARRIAFESFGDDMVAFLQDVTSQYDDAVTARRPEEVLTL
jgi:Restriction endonuclease AspBHI N-terminal/Restriction endonuclease